jgi:hypothetical protein
MDGVIEFGGFAHDVHDDEGADVLIAVHGAAKEKTKSSNFA